MNYELRYSPKAQMQLSVLSEEFVDRIDSRLRDLSESPTRLSVRVASPPYAPRGQLYHFYLVDSIGDLWFFTVIFQYSQDERSLFILSVTWREIIEQ